MSEWLIYGGVAHAVNVCESGGGSSNGWLTPPAMTETTMNGLTDACGLFCNVLDIGNRNYFSCIAAGAYTVSVYTAVGGTLISSQNIAANVQCNWQIDWADCTHNIDADTRQSYVEITPQSGQSLTLLRFNTNHPVETNVSTAPNFVRVYGVLPALITASSMFYGCYALQSATFASLPELTTATSMFYTCYSLQSVSFTSLPALTTATSMFHTCYALQSVSFASLPALTTVTNMFGAVEASSLRSVRKLSTTNLGTAFSNATTFVLRYTAIQEPEALSWVASLGSSANTITFDLRNNPFSTSTLVAPAILAKLPNATVIMV